MDFESGVGSRIQLCRPSHTFFPCRLVHTQDNLAFVLCFLALGRASGAQLAYGAGLERTVRQSFNTPCWLLTKTVDSKCLYMSLSSFHKYQLIVLCKQQCLFCLLILIGWRASQEVADKIMPYTAARTMHHLDHTTIQARQNETVT